MILSAYRPRRNGRVLAMRTVISSITTWIQPRNSIPHGEVMSADQQGRRSPRTGMHDLKVRRTHSRIYNIRRIGRAITETLILLLLTYVESKMPTGSPLMPYQNIHRWLNRPTPQRHANEKAATHSATGSLRVQARSRVY